MKQDIVLYLDSDIIVNGELKEIFDINLSSHYVAAVEEPCIDRNEILGMDF